jgi:hypothetical protein
VNPEKMSKAIQEWTRASSKMREHLTNEEFTKVLLTWIESASPETLHLLMGRSPDNVEREEEPQENEPSRYGWLKSVLKFSAKSFLVAVLVPPAVYTLTKRVRGVHIESAPCGCGGTNFLFLSQRTGEEMFSLHVGGHHMGDPGEDLEDPGPKNDDEPEPEPEDEN